MMKLQEEIMGLGPDLASILEQLYVQEQLLKKGSRTRIKVIEKKLGAERREYQ